MKHGKYKSRKTMKRATGSSQRAKYIPNVSAANRTIKLPPPPSQFGLYQYVALAMAALRAPFRGGNR